MLFELQPEVKVYELDPVMRYVIDLGPDAPEQMLRTVSEDCVAKGIKALVSGGGVSITITPIEENVHYFVKPENEVPPQVLEHLSKVLREYGMQTTVFPAGVAFMRIDGGQQ